MSLYKGVAVEKIERECLVWLKHYKYIFYNPFFMNKPTGFKSLPLSLKILFVVLIIWAIGSLTAMPMRYADGLPLFGVFVYGLSAVIVLVILDLIAPIMFLVGIWKRKTWAPKLGITYNAIFIANSIVALFVFREQLGFFPILVPTIVSSIFLIVIYLQRGYCKK